LKNKEIAETYPNGIFLGNNISYSTNSTANDFISKRIFAILNAFLGMYATFRLFDSFFNIPHSSLGVFAVTIFSLSVFSIIFLSNKKALFALIPIGIIFLLILRYDFSNLIDGVAELSEVVTGSGKGEYYSINHLICFCIFFSGLIVCFNTVFHPNVICEMLLVLPFFIIGMFYEKDINYFWLTMVIIHIAVTYVMQTAGYYAYNSTDKSNFIRIGDAFFAKSNFKVNVVARASAVTALTVFVIVMFSSLYVNVSDYERPDRVKQLRSNFIDATSLFDVNDLSGSLKNFIDALKNQDLGYIDTSNHGELGKNASLSYSNIPVAEITTSEFTTPIYLKQWVGVNYDGTGFTSLPKSAYDEMPDLEIAPQYFFEEYYKKSDNPIDKTYLSENEVYLKYHSLLKGEHSAYLPNFIKKSEDDYTPVKDTTFKSPDTADYNMNFYQYVKRSYGLDSFASLNPGESAKNSDLTVANEKYREFVEEYYLQLPDSSAMNNIRRKTDVENSVTRTISGGVASEFQIREEVELTTAYKIDIIREILQTDRPYSLDVGITPKGEDFVEYFLFNQKRGSCTYFASAGLILCRMVDIPARYCEGLVIVPSDYQNSTDTSKSTNYSQRKTFTINDTRFHAWVEIFVDNEGWVPVEFTPGYSENLVYAENPPVETKPVTTTVSRTGTRRPTGSTTKGSSTTRVTNKSNISTTVTTTSDAKVIGGINFNINKTTLFAILLITISILLPILLILLRRIKLKGQYNALGESNTKALIHYLYITDLLKFLGIERGNKDYIDFAKEVEVDRFFDATEIALKAKFSDCEINSEELETVKEISQNLQKTSFEKQTRFGKFNMWLHGLI
jgi:transglutaminase-like putative cysteine protease